MDAAYLITLLALVSALSSVAGFWVGKRFDDIEAATKTTKRRHW